MKQEDYVKALKKIKNAYLLMMIHINIGTMDILPDWLGYWFINDAIDTIGKEEESALLLKKFVSILQVYHFITWILKIGGIEIESYIIISIFSILSLYVNFQLISNIMEISKKHESKYTNKLRVIRDILTITSTFTLFPWNLYNLEIMMYISVGVMIIALIISIIQIIHFSSYITEESDKIYIYSR